jgi:Cullin protein neddylation domain
MTVPYHILHQTCNERYISTVPPTSSLSSLSLSLVTNTPPSSITNNDNNEHRRSIADALAVWLQLTTQQPHLIQRRVQLKEGTQHVDDRTNLRIMKARKTLQHQQLLAEVSSQLRFFSPNPRLVKKRIKSLIDREYLERSINNSSVYNYLA